MLRVHTVERLNFWKHPASFTDRSDSFLPTGRVGGDFESPCSCFGTTPLQCLAFCWPSALLYATPLQYYCNNRVPPSQNVFFRFQEPALDHEFCDTCRDARRVTSWTPDRLEILCNHCADVPRVTVCRHRELRGYGKFNWADEGCAHG